MSLESNYWYSISLILNDSTTNPTATQTTVFNGFIGVNQTNDTDYQGQILEFRDLSQIDAHNNYLNILLPSDRAPAYSKFNASNIGSGSNESALYEAINLDVATNQFFISLQSKTDVEIKYSDTTSHITNVSAYHYYPYIGPNDYDAASIYYKSDSGSYFFELLTYNNPFTGNYNVYNFIQDTKYFFSAVVTPISGPLYPPPLPISPICFPAGTPISTDFGDIPIERINSAIHTIGNKKIVGITKTVTTDRYVVCFEKDALGANIPSRNTIISENHCILHNNEFIKARKFIDRFNKVYKIPYNGDILYNVLMEEHGKMLVNNLICETLDPENRLAQMFLFIQHLTIDQQHHILKHYNDCVIKGAVSEHKKKFNYFSTPR